MIMDGTEEESVGPRLALSKGEAIKLQNRDSTLHELSCEDMARLVWAMHKNSYFFEVNRGLNIKYMRDINGGGNQLVCVTRIGDDKELLQAKFSVTHDKHNYIYEADLIMDRGKDYEPTVNKGTHRFDAECAIFQIDWNDDDTQLWRSDIDRLSKSPDTLSGWIDADLEMLVRCKSDWNCRRKGAIISRSFLERYAEAGLTLDSLNTRFKCYQCGEKKVSISPF